jgi:hypothetical protein
MNGKDIDFGIELYDGKNIFLTHNVLKIAPLNNFFQTKVVRRLYH